MKTDTRPIGVFDSGVGGLTVAAEIMKRLPSEKIIYFGDTARVPYGSKSKETVTKFSAEIVEFLKAFQVKAIVIACNTISSNSFEQLVEAFDIPFIEVVTPGAIACAEVTKNKKVGVIATLATIGSKAYEKKLAEIMPNVVVYSKACPLFVPLAEEGITTGEIARLTVKMYLEELVGNGIDSLILGCTHYPLLMDCISSVVGSGVNIINPAANTAKTLACYLRKNGMLNANDQQLEPEFYVSDLNQKLFGEICEIAFGKAYIAQKVDIENK